MGTSFLSLLRACDNELARQQSSALERVEQAPDGYGCVTFVTKARKDPGIHRGHFQFKFSMAPEAGFEPTTR